MTALSSSESQGVEREGSYSNLIKSGNNGAVSHLSTITARGRAPERMNERAPGRRVEVCVCVCVCVMRPFIAEEVIQIVPLHSRVFLSRQFSCCNCF